MRYRLRVLWEILRHIRPIGLGLVAAYGMKFIVRNLMDIWTIAEVIGLNVYEWHGGNRVVDIGCGIGEFAVMCALDGAIVTAIDKDHEAFAITTANATINRVITKVNVLCDEVVRPDIVAKEGADFVKMDVEGDELWILRHAQGGDLAQCRTLSLEYHDAENAHALRRELLAHGFLYRTVPSPVHKNMGYLYATRMAIGEHDAPSP